MPKFRKETEKDKKKKKKKISDEDFAFRSILVSAIIGGAFLVISLVLNGTEEFFKGILNHFIDEDITYQLPDESILNVSEVIDNTIKVSVILICFFFIFISIANYKDLSGKPAKLKDGILLGGLALLQTIRILWVFLFTLIGLVLILLYFYMVQDVKEA